MELSFVPVTNENRKEIEGLTLFENQADFIETVKECLLEADELEIWRPVGIFDSGILIGFAMYGEFNEAPFGRRIWLDRFLIGREHQGKGYGRQAAAALIKKLQTEYGCDEVFLSVYDTNKPAIKLYKGLGFRFNGEYDLKGEKVMVCKL